MAFSQSEMLYTTLANGVKMPLLGHGVHLGGVAACA